jgi:hypothetical protein
MKFLPAGAQCLVSLRLRYIILLTAYDTHENPMNGLKCGGLYYMSVWSKPGMFQQLAVGKKEYNQSR